MNQPFVSVEKRAHDHETQYETYLLLTEIIV